VIVTIPNPTVTKFTSNAPEHPFRNAKDAAYAPPVNWNIEPPIPVIGKKSEPAYKTQPPIYDVSITADIYDRTLDTRISVSQRELLALSPEVRAKMRDATTTKQIPTERQPHNTEEPRSFLQVEVVEDDELTINSALPFGIHNLSHRIPPEGAIVIPDPIKTYCRSLPPGQAPDPDHLKVAHENAAVRSVFALVDNNRKKECILDSGCQVITISKAISYELAIAYDPGFRI
jgi:hypothetical protein